MGIPTFFEVRSLNYVLGTIEIFKRSSKEKLVRYNPFVGDGDSSAFTRVCKIKPYGNECCHDKDECRVHVTRMMGRALRKKKAEMIKKKVRAILSH